MKKLTDLSSPISWLFFGLSTFLGLYVLFQPTAMEFGVFVLIDTLFLAPAVALNQYLFLNAYPDAALYFPEVLEEKIQALNLEKQRELFLSLLRFPKRRAKSIAVGSFIKVMLTSAMVVVFYWHHEGSHLIQFLKMAFLESITMTFLYGASYIEFHDLISQTLARLHKKYDWREVFEGITLPPLGVETLNPEHITMISVVLWTIALSSLILISGGPDSMKLLAYKTTAVSVMGFFLFGRLYYLNRKHLLQGLESIFETFDAFDINGFDEILPLHSSLHLARFEKTFNTLTHRLRAREKEIAEWIIFETEQSRFRAIGEISGLIAHDLAGPLHVVKFCTEELSEQIKNPGVQTHLEQLTFNTERALDLVSSLRSYLRNNVARVPKCLLNEAHMYVLQLLNMQFRKENLFQTIDFQVDEKLNQLYLKISKNDLVHILYNLYKNSSENLLQNKILGAQVASRLFRKAEDHVEIVISDNGTGLSEIKFEELTSDKASTTEKSPVRGGLGLRLTRRLIERNGGELKILPTQARSGTQFLLTLPILLSNEKTKPPYQLLASGSI